MVLLLDGMWLVEVQFVRVGVRVFVSERFSGFISKHASVDHLP